MLEIGDNVVGTRDRRGRVVSISRSDETCLVMYDSGRLSSWIPMSNVTLEAPTENQEKSEKDQQNE